MKHISSILALFLTCSVMTIPTAAQDAAAKWHDSYTEAAAEAEQSGKDLLVVFTGTNWIEMCKVFYNDILSTPAFMNPASAKFVLVKLEYNKDTGGEEQDQISQKRFLKDSYRISGFPTVLLTDAAGRPYGINGYQPIAANEYANFILGMQASGAKKRTLLAQAANLQGPEKAKMLMEGIPKLPGNLSARFYRKEMEAAVQADSDGALKLKEQFDPLIADVDYANAMAKFTRDTEWIKMLEVSDGYIRDYNLTGPNKQRVLMNKFGAYRRLDNLEGMVSCLLEVVKEDPKSPFGEDAQKILDNLRAKKIEQDMQNKQSQESAKPPAAE